MLILVSRGALSNVRKGYWAAELGAVKGLDMFAIQSEAQTTTGHPEVGQFTGILQQCPAFFLLPCSQLEQRRKEGGKKKSLFLSNRSRLQDPFAYSHLSCTGSKERGNCFQSIERRRKSDPDLSTSARNAHLHAWCGHMPNTQRG